MSLARDLQSLVRQSLAAVRVLLVLTLLLGVVYPLAVYAVGQVGFRWQAAGSFVDASGEHVTDPSAAVGSALLGQQFSGEEWFLPRASAAGEGYDPLATAGSNLGPESPELVRTIRDRRGEVSEREDVAAGDVPVDALTASGSGLDPHISPEYAALQTPRVARAHDLEETLVTRLVTANTDGRTLGVLGETRVNVLTLNIAISRLRD